MKSALSIAGLLLALVVALMVIPMLFHHDDGQPVSDQGLPWQVDALYGGKSRVFNLILGESTVADAKEKLGKDMQIALIAAPGETGSVEAFYDNRSAGFITGKMIITAELDAQTLAGMRERAPKSEYMESSTRKIGLTAEDQQKALMAPIRAISFIPSINLDPGMVEQRFGSPAERIRSSETIEHFLYPDKGLDVVLDSKGKEVLQYVAPGHFAQMRDPLLAKKN